MMGRSRPWREVWERWEMCVWLLLMPHALMLPFIGALTPIFLVEELGATAADLGLVESAQHWLTIFGSPVLGVLLRRWGLKAVVLLHMASFIGGAVMLASLSSWQGAVVVGAVQGFERSSVSMARAYFLLTQLPPSLRPRAAVLVGLSNKVNYIVAPLIGAALFEATGGSYRAIFLAQAAWCMLPVALLCFFVPWSLGRVPEEPAGQGAAGGGCRTLRRFSSIACQHAGPLTTLVVWGVLYQTCQVSWHSFVMPLRLREAGIAPGAHDRLLADDLARSRCAASLTAAAVCRSHDQRPEGGRVCRVLPAAGALRHGHGALRPGAAHLGRNLRLWLRHRPGGLRCGR